MADPIYTSASPIAVNPANGELIGGATFTVHAPDDTSFSTPLAVTDPNTGVAINPLRSNSNGTLPSFKVAGDLPRVKLKSGTFVTELVSLGGLVAEQIEEAGLDSETVSAAIAAADTATTKAGEAAASAETASDAATIATQKASAVAEVVATNDGIMTNVVNQPDSAFAAALDSLIGGFFNAISWRPAPGATAAQNRTALQAAVDQAIADQRALLIDYLGTVDVAGTVTVAGTVEIYGYGWLLTSLRQQTKPEPIFTITGSNVTIHDLGGKGVDLNMGSLPAQDGWQRYAFIYVRGGTPGFNGYNLRANTLACGVRVTRAMGDTAGITSTDRFVVDNLYVDNVWAGLVGGYFNDPQITRVRGSYNKATGTDAASPPHLIYLNNGTYAGDTTLRYTRGGVVSGILVGDGPDSIGAAVSIKSCIGTVINDVVARNCRGVLEIADCIDTTFGTVLSVDDKYPRDAGGESARASVSFSNCVRTTIESLSVRFANVDHGRAVRMESDSTDCVIQNLTIVDNSTVDSTATTVPGFDVYIQGTRNRVRNAKLTNIGAPRWAGIVFAATGTGGAAIAPAIEEGYKYSIKCNADHSRALVDYDPASVRVSRAISGSMKLSVDAGANPTIRDRSIGQTDPTGFIDEFERGVTVVGLAATDDGKTWIYPSASSASWRANASGAAGYIGAGARNLAVVEGGSPNGTLKTTVGAISGFGSGAALRAQDTDNYIGLMFNTAAANGQLDLHKRVGGTRTSLGQSAVGAVAVDSVIEIVLAGSTITVKVNGSTVITTSSATDFLTVTRHGILGTVDGVTDQLMKRIEFVAS